MPIEALIFDCDGTLADSMPLHWRAWKQVTENHGLHFARDRFYSLGGVPAKTFCSCPSTALNTGSTGSTS